MYEYLKTPTFLFIISYSESVSLLSQDCIENAYIAKTKSPLRKINHTPY